MYANAGAQIVVIPPATLQLDSTVIQGCDFMWSGIYLDQKATVKILEHSVLRDAETAIYASNKSNHYIIDSSIEDCVKGVYLPQNSSGNSISSFIWGSHFGMVASNLKPGYPGQPIFGSIPYSGIELNDVTLDIGVTSQDSNWFNNLNSGVLGFRSSLRVRNNKFENIRSDTAIIFNDWHGAAVASIGKINQIPGKLAVRPLNSTGWTMENCQTGIFTLYSTLDAYQVTMTEMLSGVKSQNCYLSSSVSYCNIEAERYGIDWRLNSGASLMNASRNTITMSGSIHGIGINLEEASTAGVPNYVVEENYNISITSGMAGIRASNVYDPQIQDNTVIQNSNGTDFPETIGILLENCDTGLVKCNTIISTDITYTSTYGMRVRATNGTTISCNQVDSNQVGFRFSELSVLNLSSNTMTNNFWGLEIDSLSYIGIQKHKGNRWVNYRDTVGAVNWDTTGTFLLSSLFRTSGLPLSVYYPAIPSWNNGWFVTQFGTEERCGPTCTIEALTDSSE
ncbi:MAG: right-handed parallel beta-helix repeat-containing protein, partial [Bacteroidota bacterium]|nr:right-handed parallel beta-helix repeat-containing protein [Bacteroidota bacterium]